MKLKTEFIESDRAERLLGVVLGSKAILSSNLTKSFYQFDFTNPESIRTFLTVLPIADKEVLQQAQSQLLPQSVDDQWDIFRARFELRGLLLDLLAESPEGIDVESSEEYPTEDSTEGYDG